MVVGGVAATWVTVKTSFKLTNGSESHISVTNQLDSVYPGLLTACS